MCRGPQHQPPEGRTGWGPNPIFPAWWERVVEPPPADLAGAIVVEVAWGRRTAIVFGPPPMPMRWEEGGPRMAWDQEEPAPWP